jgi:hypothetical protein
VKRCLLAFALVARIAAAQDSPDAGTSAVDAAPDAGATVVADSAPALPAAEPISFKAAIEKTEVTIGEPFRMTIEVRHAPDETYALPENLALKEFGVRDHMVESHGDNPQTTFIRATLQAFKTGNLEIPAIRLAVQTPGGARQLEIPPQKIKVNGVIDLSQGEPQLREDHRPLPTAYQRVWWPLVLILAFIAGVAAAVYLTHRRRNPLPAAPPKPRLPAYEEAMERLAALEREQLVATQQKQTYYFRLTEIVRDYLGRRYAFDALEQTSDELLQELRKRATWGLDFDRLTSFLRESDLVKFAKSEPSDGECKTAIDVARLFIEQTRPMPEPAKAGGAA